MNVAIAKWLHIILYYCVDLGVIKYEICQTLAALKKKLWKIMKNCFTSLITKITIGFNFEADIHIQIELSYFRKCPLLWKIGFLSHTRKVKAKYPFPDQM